LTVTVAADVLLVFSSPLVLNPDSAAEPIIRLGSLTLESIMTQTYLCSYLARETPAPGLGFLVLFPSQSKAK